MPSKPPFHALTVSLYTRKSPHRNLKSRHVLPEFRQQQHPHPNHNDSNKPSYPASTTSHGPASAQVEKERDSRTLRTACPAANGVLSPQTVDTHESGRKPKQTHPPSAPTRRITAHRFLRPNAGLCVPMTGGQRRPFAVVITAPASM
ncbi:hypothetical protein P3342_012126 [Pyrenophora teres f. teres]|nr:hypothetical protein P3342_012126 [Pyrenophora teres f. teres]